MPLCVPRCANKPKPPPFRVQGLSSPSAGVRSVLCVPVLQGNEQIGALQLVNKTDRSGAVEPFTQVSCGSPESKTVAERCAQGCPCLA